MVRKQKPKLNDYFYLNCGSSPQLKKIIFISKDIFEWGTIYQTPFGWADTKQLKPNPNKKSKVKWIINYY